MRYKLKMVEHLIQYNHFNVKHDDNIDFSFNQKTAVQEHFKLSVFSRQDKTDVPTENRTRVSRLQVRHANQYATEDC